MQTSPRTVHPTQHQLESKARHEALISQTEKLLEQLLIEFHDSIKPGLTEFGRYMKDVLICRLVLADLRHDDIPDGHSEPTMIKGKAQDSEAGAGKAKALLEAKQLVYFGKKAVYMERMWESKVFMEGWKKRFPGF